MKSMQIMRNVDNMEVLRTCIEGAIIIEPCLFKDGRGYFFESFNQREFEEKVCKTTFVQDNDPNRHTVSFVVCIFKSLLSPRVSWCA